jgi:hypothetical protein
MTFGSAVIYDHMIRRSVRLRCLELTSRMCIYIYIYVCVCALFQKDPDGADGVG